MASVAYAITTWSGAKLVETIQSLPPEARCLVIDNSQHAWPLARAWNYAVDRLCVREGFEVVVICNDDIILRPDTGGLLADAITRGQYVGGQDGKPSQELLVVSARHAALNDNRTDRPDWELLDAAKPHWEPGPDFACFATTTKLFGAVGRFDEEFNPCYFEDNDMHRRIQLAGYEGAAYAPYWHMLNGTIRTDPERQAVVSSGGFDRSRNRYTQKWGGPPGAEAFTRPYNR